jgi:putative FmdB family regulatory protein
MPIYEYECRECGIRFDKLQRFGDPQPETCPNGHKQVHRLLGPPAIIFKGSGFYVTDNGSGKRNGTSGRKSHKDKETAPASSSKTDKEAAS